MDDHASGEEEPDEAKVSLTGCAQRRMDGRLTEQQLVRERESRRQREGECAERRQQRGPLPRKNKGEARNCCREEGLSQGVDADVETGSVDADGGQRVCSAHTPNREQSAAEVAGGEEAHAEQTQGKVEKRRRRVAAEDYPVVAAREYVGGERERVRGHPVAQLLGQRGAHKPPTYLPIDLGPLGLLIENLPRNAYGERFGDRVMGHEGGDTRECGVLDP